MVKEPALPETGDPELRRPLFGWVLAVVCGTALGYFVPVAQIWLFAATGALLPVWKKRFRPAASLFLLVTTLFLCAWHAAGVRREEIRSEALLTVAREEGRRLTVTGIVGNARQIIHRKRGGPYCRFTLDDPRGEDGSPITGTRLQICYYDRSGAFPEVGEAWRLRGRLRKQSAYGTYTLSVQARSAARLPEADRTHRLTYLLHPVREALARNLAVGVSPEEAQLTQTMVLGGNNRLPYALRRRYADAGILHIFAISGLHIGIVTGLLVAVIAAFGFSLRMRALLLLPILLGYLILTGVPPSATRACCMALIYFFGPVFLRRSNLASAFAVTAAGVLLVEPAWIAHLGALLSFGVMGGILLWMRPLTTLFTLWMRVKQHRTLLANEQYGLAWHVRLRMILATYLALTLSAWFAALPLTLVFFGRVSLVGLLLNTFVPTLTIGIVWMACISSFAGFLLPPVALILNRFNAFILAQIDALSAALVALPGAVIEIPGQPGVLLFFLLQGFFIWGGILLRRWEWRHRRALLDDPFAE